MPIFCSISPRALSPHLNDPEGRPTIDHLLHGVTLRMFPVGRLDFDTEGLMLLTNHGELAQALLHPATMWPRFILQKSKGCSLMKRSAALRMASN